MDVARGPVTAGATAAVYSADGLRATVRLDGRLDAVRAPALRREFDAVLDAGARHVVVDLTDAEFLDSAALAALVRLRRRCLESGGTVTLVRPVAEDAMRVFRLTQFDQVFTMVDRPDPDGGPR